MHARPLHVPVRPLLVSVLAALMLVAAVGLSPATAQDAEYEVLVVGKTLGFRHSSIDEATNAIITLGEDNGFSVDVWDPPNDSGGWWGPGSPGQPDLTLTSTPFTSAQDLARYATIVFVSPVDNTNSLNPDTPRLLDDAELAAFQGYIRNGGGFVGLHAATDTMHTVPWYSAMSGGGARFRNHPRQQTATMVVEDQTHPSTQMLPSDWVRYDEWYNFTTNPREDVHVLITLDESTYSPGGGTMGADHPLNWCQNFEGGRSWYEGAGHTEASYVDPAFLAHVLGGIEWTAGVAGDASDCISFREVDELLASADTGQRGPNRVLVPRIQTRLDAAHAAALAGDHELSALLLTSASGMAHAVDRGLSDKLGDLHDWQVEQAGGDS